MIRRLCGVFVGLMVPVLAFAQLPVHERWLTITTPHCVVYFTEGTEAVGRRAAPAAERAYANLAKELVPPRGKIDVVISDAADASNGAATSFPRNRITINARPPVDQTSLENYDDWISLVLQHEMAHIFHLDRSRGWWRAAQRVFGRNPILFPNYYTPSWLTEGLAVYYESRYTTGGRLEGSYQYATARAAAIDGHVPRIDELSLSTSRFPYGQGAYTYGSFLVDAMARRGEAGSVGAFIEKASAAPIPFLLDRNAKRVFGETFSHAWERWRDSVARDVRATPGLASRVTLLPGEGRVMSNPRWLDDSTVIYVGDNGRETGGVYRVSKTGKPVRIERRSSYDVNDPAADGSILFAQPNFINRIYVPNDLYETRRGFTRQLTRGKRLSAPERSVNGTIVAVQTAPGTTRLVTLPANVSLSRQEVTPLTSFALDTQWAAPRWSPDGKRIVAIRLSRGMRELVVLDAGGTVLRSVLRESGILRTPAWSPDGRGIFYVSDRSGTPEVYFAPDSAQGSQSTVPVMQWPTGVYAVDVQRGAGSDSANVRFATTVLRGDGYHIAISTGGRDSIATQKIDVHSVVDSLVPVVNATGPASKYSPWRSLLPAYWSPLFSSGSSFGGQLGIVTSGRDVIGRHSYVAQALVNTDNRHVDAYAQYTYSRFLPATIELRAEQDWSYGNVSSETGVFFGRLDKVTRAYALRATFARPRVFNYSALILGAEWETYDYETTPDTLQPLLNAFFRRSHNYPILLAAVQFSNVQRPILSISPEDGVSLSLTGRQRWSTDVGGVSVPSAVLSTAAYKSLDLPGFTHHVIALRASAGVTPFRSPSVYSVGGISGGSFTLLPGITVGDQARTFPVRGYSPGTEQGNTAVSGSIEYRAPLAAPSRGLGLLPVFFDRVSLTVFADAGKATCHKSSTTFPVGGVGDDAAACSFLPPAGPTLVSVGGELNIDSALQFDVPYRFRFGVAQPLTGRNEFRPKSPSIYVTLGGSF